MQNVPHMVSPLRPPLCLLKAVAIGAALASRKVSNAPPAAPKAASAPFLPAEPDQGIAASSSGLSSSSARPDSLTHIDLSSNQFTMTGERPRAPRPASPPLHGPRPTLQHSHAASSSSPSGLASLLSALQYNEELRMLDISFNFVGPKEVRALLPALHPAASSRSLTWPLGQMK